MTSDLGPHRIIAQCTTPAIGARTSSTFNGFYDADPKRLSGPITSLGKPVRIHSGKDRGFGAVLLEQHVCCHINVAFGRHVVHFVLETFSRIISCWGASVNSLLA